MYPWLDFSKDYYRSVLCWPYKDDTELEFIIGHPNGNIDGTNTLIFNINAALPVYNKTLLNKQLPFLVDLKAFTFLLTLDLFMSDRINVLANS